jgi:hypothetical protein
LTILRRRTEPPRQVRDADSWSGPAYTVKVRAVCRQCNNGWMSELEQETRPLLEPMLHGETRILDADRQTLLARWAFKTMTMLEFVYPQERAIQQTDTSWLYEHREPPASAIIWVASYRGTDHNSFYRHDVMQPRRQTSPGAQILREHDALLPPPVAYGVNFGVQHVAFQVFGTTEPDHRFGHAGFASAAFEQIWPPRFAFTWPPAAALDDRSLPRVLQIFATAGTR